MIDVKERLKTWKLLMSSLFSRSMPYLITGLSNNDWIYTNTSPKELQKQILDASHVIQFVHLKKTDLYSSIVESFPLIGKASMILSLRDMNSVINKNGIENYALTLEGLNVIMKPLKQEDPAQLAEPLLVGRLLSQYELSFYLHYKEQTDSKYYKVISQIHPEELLEPKASINYVKLRLARENSTDWEWFRLPLLDGLNYPSLREYAKKSGCDQYILNAEVKRKNSSVEVVVAFDDDNLSVRTYFPKRIWFPVRETKPAE